MKKSGVNRITPLGRSHSLAGIDFQAGAALLINKPSGITSFGVVRQVRKLIGVQKVGHAGTLDPAATGLLILLTGKATRSQSEFMALDKEYSAQILLGVETTTWDLDGEVIEKKAVPLIKKTDLEALVADRFSGEIDQIPPAFSAVKQQGVPSYRRARRGQPIKLESRKVRVHEIEIQDWTSPEITLRVSCSSGFYVRSLAHDIGAAIGCGGTLKQLVRTRIGPHHLKEALSLDELAVKLSQCPI